MAVRRCFTVLGAAQIQVFDDSGGAAVEMIIEYGGQFCVGNLTRAEGIHIKRYGLGDADRVGELHLAALSKASCYNIFGNVSRHVRGAPIHLGRVFPAEGAAAVAPHSAVGIHDNFAARQAGIADGSPDDEAAGGIDVVRNGPFYVCCG